MSCCGQEQSHREGRQPASLRRDAAGLFGYLDVIRAEGVTIKARESTTVLPLGGVQATLDLPRVLRRVTLEELTAKVCGVGAVVATAQPNTPKNYDLRTHSA